MIVIIKTVLFRTDIASIPVVRTLMVIYYYSDDDADASNANKNNDADNDDDVGGVVRTIRPLRVVLVSTW